MLYISNNLLILDLPDAAAAGRPVLWLNHGSPDRPAVRPWWLVNAVVLAWVARQVEALEEQAVREARDEWNGGAVRDRLKLAIERVAALWTAVNAAATAGRPIVTDGAYLAALGKNPPAELPEPEIDARRYALPIIGDVLDWDQVRAASRIVRRPEPGEKARLARATKAAKAKEKKTGMFA